MDTILGLITTSEETHRIVNSIAAEFGVKIITAAPSIERTKRVALELADKGAKCIIARGRIAHIVDNLGLIPVVDFNPRPFDLCLALSKIPKNIKEVVVVVYEPRTHYNPFSDSVIKGIEQISGRSLRPVFLSYSPQNSIGEVIAKEFEKGSTWFVGTLSVVNIVRERGFHAIELVSGQGALRDAIDKALYILENQKRIMMEAAILNDVIDITKQGVITTDEKGTVTAINNHAARLLLKEKVKLGSTLGTISDDLMQSIKNGEAIEAKIFSYGDKNIVINQKPMFLENEVIGAVINIQDTEVIEQLEGKIRSQLRQRGLVARWDFNDILGKSEAIQETKKEAFAYAKTDFNILISGETGTGKEMLAHSIHQASNKNEGPFIVVNCSALPETLLESELFGYDPGAFTGAKKEGKAGLFELANGGTIFLDEINSVNYPTQAKLLRVIEDKRVMRLGSDRFITSDVRVISASNRNLWDMVSDGIFRIDLYFRLNELSLFIQPLRNRAEDISVFIDNFLHRYDNRGYKKEEILALIQKTAPCYGWPGNVRELENLLKRIITLMDRIPIKDLSAKIREEFLVTQDPGLEEGLKVSLGSLDEMENELILQVARICNNDMQKIAACLGVSSATGWRRLKKARAEKVIKEH